MDELFVTAARQGDIVGLTALLEAGADIEYCKVFFLCVFDVCRGTLLFIGQHGRVGLNVSDFFSVAEQ
jgi:hypothetical protein